jgi:hypothetical protein
MEDRSPHRLQRWSAAFWTSKVPCQRLNHCRWKNQTGATYPRTRDRTPELTPPHDYDIGEEIRTAGLHPQTQHRTHHLPSVTYSDNRLSVLLDNTSSLFHHDIGANAVVTGQSRRMDTPDWITASASTTPSKKLKVANPRNRQTHDAINSETPPWRAPPVWEWSWGRFIHPGAAPTTPTALHDLQNQILTTEWRDRIPPPCHHRSSRLRERGPSQTSVEMGLEKCCLPGRLPGG